MKERYFAVSYSSHALTCINQAVRVEECVNSEAALRKVTEWRKEYPNQRHVVRRESEPREA